MVFSVPTSLRMGLMLPVGPLMRQRIPLPHERTVERMCSGDGILHRAPTLARTACCHSIHNLTTPWALCKHQQACAAVASAHTRTLASSSYFNIRGPRSRGCSLLHQVQYKVSSFKFFF